MNNVVTSSTTPMTNIERLIRWRSEYTRLTADVDNWLRAIGYTATPRTKMLALPAPAQKSNAISAYLRGGI